jgi:predicted nuclease of predicted toxin-antitoxin system
MSPDFPVIVADESVDSRIIKSLVGKGYSVYSIARETPGITDSVVIEIAVEKQAYIITEDKDFGDELVYRKKQSVGGMLLRMPDVPIESRIKLVVDTFLLHGKELNNCFSVLTSKKLRIRKYL